MLKTLLVAQVLVLVSLAGPVRAEPTAAGERRRTSDITTKTIGPSAPPSADLVRTRTLEWVAQRGVTDKSLLEEIGRLWAQPDQPLASEVLFDLTIQSFTLADDTTRAFVDACGLQHAPLLPPEAKLLEQADAGRYYLANMSLFYGRYLAHRQMFEEALDVLEKAPLADVVDPASLLFFKAVCQHHLLQKTEGLATIEQLLKNTEGVPVRYSTVAALMQYDLESLRDQSLDEVARKMTDVERRLELGRTGQKVQKKEDEIIVTLDELIKKIEEQSGGGGGGAGGKSSQPNAPATDSVIKGATAPGKVDPKKFKNAAEWGDLPPKARAKVNDHIAREFPAHYRDAMEEYSRKEANRAAGKGK
jgi:tetratricopeptide (TPR) repeat protein